MSVHVSAYVWEHSTHKGTELLLLLAIADIAHRNGVAFPSVTTLARFIRMSDRNTTRVIAKLEKSGELEVKRNSGPHGTHLFRVKMNLTLPLFAVDNKGANLSPDKTAGDTVAQEGVTNPPAGGDTATSYEPKEPKTERKEGAERRTRVPKDFGISANVRAWAVEKGWEPFLPAHLEKFKLTVGAHGSRYVDWDKALMNCIADDWGDVRRNALRAPGAASLHQSTAPKTCRYCTKTAVNMVSGIPFCSAKACENAAYDGKPAPKPRQAPEARA